MSERYKTITLDDFSDGEQCDLIAPSKNSVKFSESLVIEKNKTKLGPKIKGGVLYDSGLIGVDSAYRVTFMYGGHLYLLGTNETDCFIKKCSSAGSWTAVATLPDSSDDAPCIIKFRKLVIVNYRNNAKTAYLVKYSTNGLTMTAFADTNLVALSGVSDFRITDYAIVHDRLYVLGGSYGSGAKNIYYTDDGITFTLFVTLDSAHSYYSLEYLSGYLYIDNNSSGSGSGLMRISMSGEIQDAIVSFTSYLYLRHRIFAGNSYLLIDGKKLYRVDGSSLILVFNFETFVWPIFCSGFVNSLFFWGYSGKALFEMDVNEKMSRRFSVLGSVDDINCIHVTSNDIVFSIQCEEEGNSEAVIYEVAYTASGNIQTRLIKAQGVPKQIVLRHKPLAANTSIKVYIKKDQASSWGDAVINSATTNAIKKVYDFPAGTELDFIEFKIEYLTSDSTKSPEDAIIDFIYLPVGLANSK